MTEWKLINSFHIPQEVWDKAEIKAKEWGWTVEAVLCDSLEKSFDYSDKEDEEDFKPRFRVILRPEALLPNCEVINNYERDRNNDFVGTFQGISDKESLLRMAKEGYGISEDEIEFVDN